MTVGPARSLSRAAGAAVLAAAIVTATIVTTAPVPASAGGPLPLFVYRDAGSPLNHGYWGGIVPPGAAARTRVDIDNRERLASGPTAIRIDFELPLAAWTAVVVTSAPDYWGTLPGAALDLGNARRLVFQARGAHGGERIRVKAAVAGDQPHGDSAELPIDSGWLELTASWQRFVLPVDVSSLRRVVTPFVVIANRAHNPSGQATIYLDEIYFE